MKRLLILVAMLVLPVLAWARGLSFTEEMHGYAYHGGEYRKVSVYFDIVIKDIDAWRSNQNYAATVSGKAVLDRLPAVPVTGTLQILAPAPGANLTGDPGRLLTYRFAGPGLQFVGVKHVYNNAGMDMIDDMTTLHGVFQAAGQPQPTVQELLYGSAWTSELHFEWWKPATMASFSFSFKTIATPWYEDLAVRILFLKTVFGDLAKTFFPWAV
ncbi:hypothetical protein G4G28_16900 [Massilia sp. Dwa41.01b]|uniref:hypothetical protein n=1 Tax=unclassified Massilia TaxID=2609279 RepID=UPI0016027942|nr:MULTISPECIES: hypothetical protein [unclassified Massilia]QNA89736.1 hypothetical protein G4G28_16900 [Massilia sp. Dwa41.01b]QNB00633.1 hypothetical protein G4G31_20475 [Massilia sp. Se16.2.3]